MHLVFHYHDEMTAAGDVLTCGSSIKLKHKETKYWLHSHSINWGTGSGQQSVTSASYDMIIR